MNNEFLKNHIEFLLTVGLILEEHGSKFQSIPRILIQKFGLLAGIFELVFVAVQLLVGAALSVEADQSEEVALVAVVDME